MENINIGYKVRFGNQGIIIDSNKDNAKFEGYESGKDYTILEWRVGCFTTIPIKVSVEGDPAGRTGWWMSEYAFKNMFTVVEPYRTLKVYG